MSARTLRPLRLAAGLLCAALLPAAAGAAARPATEAARAAGVRLQWPAGRAMVVVKPGAAVRVGVRPLRRRSARVTVVLERAADGRVLARRSLRRGAVSLRLPRATGVRYVLSARAGRRLLRRATLVVLPARPKPSPADACRAANGPSSGTLVADRETLAPGQTLTVTFTNTSDQACLSGGVGYDVERLGEDGAWRSAGFRGAFPTVAVTLRPGQRQAVAFVADERSFTAASERELPLPAGRYRIVQRWRASHAGDDAVLAASVEFTLRGYGPTARCGPADRTPAASVRADLVGWSVVRIANDGGVCLRLPETLTIEHVLGDGSVEPAGTIARGPCPGSVLTPGNFSAYGAWGTEVPRLEPGRYRVAAAVTAVPVGGPDAALTPAVEFELTQPYGGGIGPIPSCVPPDWL